MNFLTPDFLPASSDVRLHCLLYITVHIVPRADLHAAVPRVA